jgi:gamma-glutamyltranspeptidase/glutathione hydrolase
MSFRASVAVLAFLASVSLPAASFAERPLDHGVTGAIPGPGEVGRGDRYSGRVWATRSPVLARNGMAATAHPLATQIAVDILKKGGSAVDAAIAANAALGLMEPVSCGIGGDLFAIVWDPKTRKLYGYNASGTAPKGRDLARMTLAAKAAASKLGVPHTARVPLYGSLSVSVPGAVDGWFALHGRFGKLPMKDLLAPSIGYARAGVPVGQLIAQIWKRNFGLFQDYDAIIEEKANARATYLIDGHTPVEGEVFRNPDLAATYEAIAVGGRDVYYKGAIAKGIDAYFRRIGGDMRYSDLAGFQGEWVEPRGVNYHGYDVFQLPPNSQGFGVLQMLKLLQPYDLKAMGAGTLKATGTVLEAKRLAYEDMAKFYGDPRFGKFPADALLSDSYAAERRKLINPEHPDPALGPGDPQLRVGDTTYLTVADKDGMMVSFIQSNYSGLGSGLVADHAGFMFHNRANLFSLDPKSPNGYAPGKRPFHTLIPGFVMKDGAPFMSFGVMGGDMQAQGQVQVLVNIIDFGMNVQEAGDAARWYHGGTATVTGEKSKGFGTVAIESGYSDAVKTGLKARGFNVIPPGWEFGNDEFGGYQAIMWDRERKVYWGASEMRKDGAALGY